ncbi:EpsG family protein [Shewanella xiamenensis]|uniref:EpsG family protein n=1 Tax=Shewanella xiamenensis TaxID=332186 RepID=UPI0035B8CA50
MTIFNLPVFFIFFSVVFLVSRAYQKIASVLIILLLTLVAGTRFYSDIDYGPYIDLFKETPLLENITLSDILILYGEPGYLIFTSLIKSANLDFFAVTILFSFASISIKLYVCSYLVRNYILAFSLFLCLHFLTVEFIELRWALSSAFVMLAIFFELKDKTKYFFLCIILASIFHYFSFLFLCVLLFRYFTFKKSLVIFMLSFFIAIAYKTFSPSVDYSLESDIYIVRRLFRYLNNPESSVGLFSYLRILMYLVVVYTIYLYRSRLSEFEIKLAMYSSLLISLSLMISFVPLLYFRSMVVSDLFMIILMVNLIFKFGLIYRYFFVASVSILFSTWNIIDVINYQTAGYIFEYKTWLNFLI